MPCHVAQAPRRALTVILACEREAPLPLFTANDALSGLITSLEPVGSLTVSLRLCYRLISGLPCLGWDHHLSPGSDCVETCAYEVASWKGDGRAGQSFAFGPFPLAKTRCWTLSGSTNPGQAFTSTILRPGNLPPSFDRKWHHLYWQLCIDFRHVHKKRRLVTVPILFFPSIPLVETTLSNWNGSKQECRHQQTIEMRKWGCLGTVGKLGVTLRWPKMSAVQEDDEKDVLLANLPISIILTLDVLRSSTAAVRPDEIAPCALYLRTHLRGSASQLDDVVSRDILDSRWEKLCSSEDSITYRTEIRIPDSCITTFECRAFLFAATHTLQVPLRLPFWLGRSVELDVPVVITRATGSVPLQAELGRLSAGFKVVEHSSGHDRMCAWASLPSRTVGEIPDFIRDGEEMLSTTGKPSIMLMNGDGFPEPPHVQPPRYQE